MFMSHHGYFLKKEILKNGNNCYFTDTYYKSVGNQIIELLYKITKISILLFIDCYLFIVGTFVCKNRESNKFGHINIKVFS